MMNSLFRIVEVLFWVFLAGLLLGGLVIVGGQLAGVIALNESTVVNVSEVAGPWAFSSATLCGVCAFVLRYKPEDKSRS